LPRFLSTYPLLGQDFFPSVDAGTFRLHVRVRSGTRIEETAKDIDEIEADIRREIPTEELHAFSITSGYRIRASTSATVTVAS